ncbi:MAG TPA: hypothetical protein VEX35_05470 [Allosphingosinicella sp.]|nr:hypothetical protein [Allosphingosinicella sp.]
MTRQARESFTALIAVLFIFGVLWLLPLLLKDVVIPRWALLLGLGLQIAIVIGAVIRRRDKPAESPE